MNQYSKTSRDKLLLAHPDIQKIFDEAIKLCDCTVIYTTRSKDEQFELYKKGRSFVNGKWIVTDKGRVVTNIDGVNITGKHNKVPSEAIDVIPYPIDWNDTDRIRYFAGIVMGISLRMKEEGLISHDLIWGGDWDRDTDLKDQTLNDLVHFELV